MKLLTFIFLTITVCASGQTKPTETVATGKIGYLDVEKLVAQLPEYKKLQDKMEETRRTMSDKMYDKQQNFQRVYTDYAQNVKTMADTTRARYEAQLQQLDNDIQQFRNDAVNTFENTKKLMLAPVYLKLGSVIRDVAIENGYIMILPYTVHDGELLLHSDPKLDVAPLVLKKMTEVK